MARAQKQTPLPRRRPTRMPARAMVRRPARIPGPAMVLDPVPTIACPHVLTEVRPVAVRSTVVRSTVAVRVTACACAKPSRLPSLSGQVLVFPVSRGF